MLNYAKIGQSVAVISRFLVILKMVAAAILDFQKFEMLSVCPLWWASLHHRARFH